MNIRNFIVYDNDFMTQQALIKERIRNTEQLINELYYEYDHEIAVEYNSGSIMQQYEIPLVIYNNPEFDNNPYVFMYIDTDQYHILVDQADIKLFSSFAIDDRFADFKHTLEVGFHNIPKTFFLGEKNWLEQDSLPRNLMKGKMSTG